MYRQACGPVEYQQGIATQQSVEYIAVIYSQRTSHIFVCVNRVSKKRSFKFSGVERKEKCHLIYTIDFARKWTKKVTQSRHVLS